MVLREQTVVQIDTLVKDLGKPLDLGGVHGIVKDNGRGQAYAKTSSKSNEKLDFDNYRIKACMGNNLFHSVFKFRFKKVKMMLDRGFDVNMKNSYGYSILIAALHIEDDIQREKMFQFLLNRGADALMKDRRHSRNILSWSALLGRFNEVTFLLDKYLGDIDLNDKDVEGMTALHHATHGGHVDVVQLLALEYRKFGISVDIPDALGLTPYLHARRLGFNRIAQVLQDKGRACPGQGDLFTFRNGKEWSELGYKERENKMQTRRFSDFMQAAIFGRSRLVHQFMQPRKVPEIKVTDSTDELDGPRMKFVVKEKNPNRHIESQYQEQQQQRMLLSVEQTPSSTLTRQSVAFSMLDMTPGSKLRDADQFKRSQAEPHRMESKGHHGHSSHNQYITNMMGLVSSQNTPSFRPTVIVPTPEPEVTPTRQKKSTLALLFGRDKRKKKSKSPKAEKKLKCVKEKKGGKSKK